MADVDESAVYIEGPWTHKTVSANGSTFHLAECGTGPLVILLHGFADFWWTWRHQLPMLAKEGYRAIAMDLRGYGASDKPPRGYDAYTSTDDVTGLIRALGENRATLIGHDWGGIVAQAAAVLKPEMVADIAMLGSCHPLRLRSALASDRKQIAAARRIFAFQLPRYEHRITANNGAYVADAFEQWAGPAWRASPEFREHVAVCRNMIQIQQAAFCAMEYYRWAIRSLTRRSGWVFARQMAEPIAGNVLQLHGTLDSWILPSTAQGAENYGAKTWNYQQLDGVGHFPHLEATQHVNGELLAWLQDNSL